MMHRRMRAALLATTLVSAATVALASGTPFTITPGTTSVIPGGYVADHVQAQAGFTASDLFLGDLALYVAEIQGVAPATVRQTTEDPFEAQFPSSLTLTMPYARLVGEADVANNSYRLTGAAFSGGLQITVPSVLPSGRLNAASKGGSLTLSNLQVSLETKTILADITGGNDVGTVRAAHVWDFATVAGSTALDMGTCPLTPTGPCSPLSVQGITLSGLTLREEAFELFSQSLGLKPLGVAGLAGVSDYGTLTISAVPEAGAGWLSLAGLLVLARRTRRAASAAVH